MSTVRAFRVIAAILMACTILFTEARAADLDPKFLQSIVLVRPGIEDLSDTVQLYVDRLKGISLSDGSNPKVLGWSKKNNQYTLKLKFVGETVATLTFVHDLSARSDGKVSLLLPVEMDGQKIPALLFTTLFMRQ